MRFLTEHGREKQNPLSEPVWVPCRECERTGWNKKSPRRPGIHPSQIASPCLLKIYNEMIGKESREKIAPRTQLIFDVGSAIHTMFQGYGQRGAWGPKYKKELTIAPEYQELAEQLMIEGHADAENFLIIDTIEGYPIYEVGLVHEYKSMHTDAFKKLTRPKPTHKQQAMLYSAALNRPIVVYMYLNKNDQNIHDFPVAFEPEVWETIQRKAAMLNVLYDNETPPEGEAGYHCDECGYAYDCPALAAKKTRRIG